MNIEQLNLSLKYGEIVIFQDEDDKFIGIGGAGKDEDGDYRRSNWCNSIEEILQTIGSCGVFTQDDLKEKLKRLKYIKSIPWALSDPIPDETKVKILDNAEEECERFGIDWDSVKRAMVGKVCKIYGMDGSDYYILNEDKSDTPLFPRSAFVIAVEEKSLGVFKDMDATIAKFNDALVDMGLEVKKIKK